MGEQCNSSQSLLNALLIQIEGLAVQPVWRCFILMPHLSNTFPTLTHKNSLLHLTFCAINLQGGSTGAEGRGCCCQAFHSPTHRSSLASVPSAQLNQREEALAQKVADADTKLKAVAATQVGDCAAPVCVNACSGPEPKRRAGWLMGNHFSSAGCSSPQPHSVLCSGQEPHAQQVRDKQEPHAKQVKELLASQEVVTKERSKLEALQSELKARRSEVVAQVGRGWGVGDVDGVSVMWDGTLLGWFRAGISSCCPSVVVSTPRLDLHHMRTCCRQQNFAYRASDGFSSSGKQPGMPLRWMHGNKRAQCGSVWMAQEKELAKRDKATSKDAATAAKQLAEVARRSSELDAREAEVKEQQAALAQRMADAEAQLKSAAAIQEREVTASEKKASKEMASAAKQVHENVKRTKELNQQEAEVSKSSAVFEAHAAPLGGLIAHVDSGLRISEPLSTHVAGPLEEAACTSETASLRTQPIAYPVACQASLWDHSGVLTFACLLPLERLCEQLREKQATLAKQVAETEAKLKAATAAQVCVCLGKEGDGGQASAALSLYGIMA
eukprot:1143063-Pelagomonas_calceolata.AAC.1